MVMMLVIFTMFLVFVIATAGLVSRQFHVIVDQEQEEQAFQLADAGVNYAVWLLQNNLVNLASPAGVNDHEITDFTKNPEELIGTFDLSFATQSGAASGPVLVNVTSVGEDAVKKDRKQTIDARLYSADRAAYAIIGWNHRP